jgi:hypothetical protein
MLHWDTQFSHSQCYNYFVADFLESFLLMDARCFCASFGTTAVLPTWKDLISSAPDDKCLPLPPHGAIVGSYLTVKNAFTASDQANQYPFMCNGKLQTVWDHASSRLKDVLGFSREQLKSATITYYPLAFLMAIPVTRWQLFPNPFSQHWARLALDLPVDERPQTCPGCGIAQDATGHHRAMCSKRDSRAWKRGHDHVVVRLWVLIMTCLPSLSLLSKLRFCTIWILRSAVTYLQSAKLHTTRIWILTFP